MSQTQERTLFVTGVTGFLGRHFLLSQLDSALNFVVLVRAATIDQGRERVLDALRSACDSQRQPWRADEWDARVEVILGDIGEPGCGISACCMRRLRQLKIAQFWHFAASLNFEEKHRNKIWQRNVQGTSHVLELARDLASSQFFHCSTAYTIAARAGLAREVLHPLEGPFNNLYEETKCIAEHKVVEFCRAHGMRSVLLRPSIVIGPRISKSPGGSTTGVYTFLKRLYLLRAPLQTVGRSVVVSGNPKTKLNLVPVDAIMRDIEHFTQPETQLEDGAIFHLTGDWHPDLTRVLAHISAVLGVPTIQIGRNEDSFRTPLESIIDRETAFHSVYLDSELTFERSLPSRYGVTEQEFVGYVNEAFAEFGCETPQRVFDLAHVASFDGTVLKAYSAGSSANPAVVLVNAIGMPMEFWTRFAKELSKQCFVLTWESRGCPNVDLGCDLSQHSFEDHARDLCALLDYFGIAQAQLVGWCSGAQIALKAASMVPSRITAVASVNGSFSTAGGVAITDFENKLREVMPRIASDKRMAEVYFNVVYGRAEGGGRSLATENEQASAVLSSVEPSLLHLTSRPFEDVESLFRYARLMSASLSEPVREWIDDVRSPVFVYTGKRDETAHPECSKWVADRLRDCSLVVDDEADHFALCQEDVRVIAHVSRFLEQQRAAGAAV
jgi:nucleoside-diphosphate-sugar epimerase/pimeloyl-ACP methyl ester carboxylesterase